MWALSGLGKSQVHPYLNQPAAYSLIKCLRNCCSKFPSQPGRLVSLDWFPVWGPLGSPFPLFAKTSPCKSCLILFSAGFPMRSWPLRFLLPVFLQLSLTPACQAALKAQVVIWTSFSTRSPRSVLSESSSFFVKLFFLLGSYIPSRTCPQSKCSTELTKTSSACHSHLLKP